MENGNRNHKWIIEVIAGALLAAFVIVLFLVFGFFILKGGDFGSLADWITAITGIGALVAAGYAALSSSRWMRNQWHQMQMQSNIASIQLFDLQSERLRGDIADFSLRTKNLRILENIHKNYVQLMSCNFGSFLMLAPKFSASYRAAKSAMDMMSGASSVYFINSDYDKEYGAEINKILRYQYRYTHIFGEDSGVVFETLKSAANGKFSEDIGAVFKKISKSVKFDIYFDESGSETEKLKETQAAISRLRTFFNKEKEKLRSEYNTLQERRGVIIDEISRDHHSPLNKSLKSLPDDELTTETG
ncbi:hypothetical protein SAMN04515647_3822 [Cohaesibacter sp. ES.047]|uniref:hypothetical protein n=1 Tax=Cohaesibacter sp. ES.047 TaxID=1798205 RepID=UPI000BB96B9C|nr:hypothetical protein [Cohaesibacter sp. ES.047]SNY93523.1 hypothetical protein SAMN04515647_3822 [Cohaesibacter sp. ES.047]